MSNTRIFKQTLPQSNKGSSAFQAVRRRVMRVSAFALLAASASLMWTSASAADSTSEIAARYQSEAAACHNGTSNQDRATCLREAGAARAEARNGKMNQRGNDYQQNATKRCDALPTGQRDDCMRMHSGEGTSSGSVGGGGIIREIVTPITK
jgi:hypothetical protein